MMSFGVTSFGVGKPSCVVCQSTDSPMWHRRSKDRTIVTCCRCIQLIKQPLLYHGTDGNDSVSAAVVVDDDDDDMDEQNKESTTTDTLPQTTDTICKLEDFPPSNTVLDVLSSQVSVISNSSTSSSKTEQSTVKKDQPTRRSSRSNKGQKRGNGGIIKGKGRSRRTAMFKKQQPAKAATIKADITTSDSVFYKGTYYQCGDVVCLLDSDDGRLYYAQIRGFIMNEVCEKSAVITWLLPTQGTVGENFNPATYILGPDEDFPRRMEYMEFVCHAPSDYFKCRVSPYELLGSLPITKNSINTQLHYYQPHTKRSIFGASS